MKTSGKFVIFLLFMLGASSLMSEVKAADVNSFLGRWALFLPGGAGWLEVKQENGYLDGNVLWYGGSVVPVSYVFYWDGQLLVTRNSNVKREGDKTQTKTSWLELKMNGQDMLSGKYYVPKNDGTGVEVTDFTGKRIPPVPAAPDLSNVEYDKPIKLFNGKNLDGWKLTDPEATNGWSVKEGVLVNNPVQKPGEPHIHYGNLQTDQKFNDFNLKIQVNVPAESNSGIYLKGIYEVQVFDSYGKPLDSHNMGAIYSRITPSVSAEKPAGEWQDLDITLVDRHVTVYLNGTKIIDNAPVYGVTGGALNADEFSPGPIYLQGDHGTVMYRNIVLTPVKE